MIRRLAQLSFIRLTDHFAGAIYSEEETVWKAWLHLRSPRMVAYWEMARDASDMPGRVPRWKELCDRYHSIMTMMPESATGGSTAWQGFARRIFLRALVLPEMRPTYGIELANGPPVLAVHESAGAMSWRLFVVAHRFGERCQSMLEIAPDTAMMRMVPYDESRLGPELKTSTRRVAPHGLNFVVYDHDQQLLHLGRPLARVASHSRVA